MSSALPTQPPPSGTPEAPAKAGHGFGTLPVFLAAVSTILGAVMFLRFGYAVGHLGLLGSIAIIALGHVVTIPTAMAISEIATNRKVEGGGEYFIVSRSFGARIGAAIGLSLYLSQAISVAFYCIAFAEAFAPLAGHFESLTGIAFQPRMVSLPITVILILLMLIKGAAIGVKTLYGVVVVLAVSLVLFFLGKPVEGAAETLRWTARVAEPDDFFVVFAICFPAFTGMTAGVGLSGDLARPARSIPLGTMAGTLVGMVVYVALVWKLTVSATPELLAEDQLVMGRIALWSPIIPIGLGCATLSSAIGSILVAPRTLQALGRDGAFLGGFTNRFLAKGKGEADEPRNATLLTAILAITFVSLGDVNFVARLISMFFMVTYGALCTASLLEHFAATPGYRPSFRSRWYLSLIGAVMCLLMMFQMDPIFAVLALVAMGLFYWLTKFTPAGESGGGIAVLLRGVMTQLTRRLQIRLQREEAGDASGWRPAIIMVSGRTFSGSPLPLRLLGWLAVRQGFGTYLHYVEGFLEPDTARQRRELRHRLVELQERDLAGVYVEVMVSPSMRSALAQTLQVPGVSGMENNTVLFALRHDDADAEVEEVVEHGLFSANVDKNVLVLRHGDTGFGRRRTVHLWLTWDDERHAALMVMLGYILLGHQDWRGATIHVFAAVPSDRIEETHQRFSTMLADGRLPISPKNVRFLPVNSAEEFSGLVETHSANADLVVRSLRRQTLETSGVEALRRHQGVKAVLFVHSAEEVTIS
ncbi:MAG: amino acid permease [Deltaproteobacteria bacterium]|nr:amino acid permease [Deltaproteobacteria bacterium]